MNRGDIQKLVCMREKEARILYEHGRFDGAYYLLGYAVECALKSCISKQFKENDIPDKKLVNDCYTHQLNSLLKLSGLETQFKIDSKKDPVLERYWNTVKLWSEQHRYRHGISWRETKDFYEATTDSNSGVLKWLKNYW